MAAFDEADLRMAEEAVDYILKTLIDEPELIMEALGVSANTVIVSFIFDVILQRLKDEQ